VSEKVIDLLFKEANLVVFGFKRTAQFLDKIRRMGGLLTQQPPAKAGGLVLRTKVRIRVIRPV